MLILFQLLLSRAVQFASRFSKCHLNSQDKICKEFQFVELSFADLFHLNASLFQKLYF